MGKQRGSEAISNDQTRPAREGKKKELASAEQRLADLLAKAGLRQAEEELVRKRETHEVQKRRGLLQALSAAQGFEAPTTNEKFAAEWAPLWIDVATRLKANHLEWMVEIEKLPDDPGYDVARFILGEALAESDSARIASLIQDSIKSFAGHPRERFLSTIFLLLRDAVHEHWWPTKNAGAAAPSIQTENRDASGGLSMGLDQRIHIIHERVQAPDLPEAAAKVLRILWNRSDEWFDAVFLESIGVPPSTLHHAATKHWQRGVDYKSTHSRRREYHRTRLIKWVTYEWDPEAPASATERTEQ